MSVRARRDRTRLRIELRLAEEDKPLARALYEQCILLEAEAVPLFLAAGLSVWVVVCLGLLLGPKMLSSWLAAGYVVLILFLALLTASLAIWAVDRWCVVPREQPIIHALQAHLRRVPAEQAERVLAFLAEHDTFVAKRREAFELSEQSSELGIS